MGQHPVQDAILVVVDQNPAIVVFRIQLPGRDIGIQADAVGFQLFRCKDCKADIPPAPVPKLLHRAHDVGMAAHRMVDVGGCHIHGNLREIGQDRPGLPVHAGADGYTGGKQVRRHGNHFDSTAAAHAQAGDIDPVGIHLSLVDHPADQIGHLTQVSPDPAPILFPVGSILSHDHLEGVVPGIVSGYHLLHGDIARRRLRRHNVHIRQAFCQLDGPQRIRKLLHIVRAAGAAAMEEQDQRPGAVGIRLINPIHHTVFHAGTEQLLVEQANLIHGIPGDLQTQFFAGNGKIAAVIDGGACQVGVESTVICFEDAQTVRILRPGYITKEDLEQVAKTAILDPAILHDIQAGQTVRSPGMKYQHYSPQANVILVEGSDDAFCAYVSQHQTADCYALVFDGEEQNLSIPCLTYGKNSAEQAQHLFDCLRHCDEIGAKTVYVRAPKRDGIGLAVYNRLIRAAGFEVIQL